jgi:hypothetical protein
MADTQIESIETKLLNLTIDGDTEAAQQHADLYLSRLDWERTRSAELRRVGRRYTAIDFATAYAYTHFEDPPGI